MLIFTHSFQILNDDEIVTSVQEESNPVDDETDEDDDNNNESSKGPSNAKVFSALETVMECYEQQIDVLLNYCSSKGLETLQRKNGVQWYSEKQVITFHNKGKIATCCTYFAFSSSVFPACDDFQYSYSVRYSRKFSDTAKMSHNVHYN
ncbi:UNVERIFIED_CONTAM: hypothetical protein NCL1_47803 [Trichonephila clavipes]